MSSVIKEMSLRTNSIQRLQNPTANLPVASNQAPRCTYCEVDHYPLACNTKIKSVRDRHAFLLRIGDFFNCLKPQNHTRYCKSHKKCKHYHKNIINLFVKDQHFQILQNNRLPLNLQKPLLKPLMQGGEVNWCYCKLAVLQPQMIPVIDLLISRFFLIDSQH